VKLTAGDEVRLCVCTPCQLTVFESSAPVSIVQNASRSHSLWEQTAHPAIQPHAWSSIQERMTTDLRVMMHATSRTLSKRTLNL
jgi:hypothetical protein